MTVKVVVVDFGAGNLLSVEQALRHCGAGVKLADTEAAIASADRLLLPGVGAFGDCFAAIERLGLVEPILEFAATERPFLGICIGMQMMFDASEEFGEHAGLGLVPGRVRRIADTDDTGERIKVPHIGWNALRAPEAGGWEGTILSTVPEGSSVYFVHSYFGEPVDPAHRLADCCYGGHRITAAIQRDNLFGCQFHPEKSGAIGLGILSQFLRL